jgi:hypothetical protein
MPHKNVSEYILNLVEQSGKDGSIHIEKQADGRYKIIAVSTAAVKDYEGETFSTAAMDYDIAAAIHEKQYPEFRVFHQAGLGVGKVEKMSRIGIFAIDEGYSYTDPFSLQVCEKMLANNDGKWKVSRGFKVYELSGGCPDCGESLVVETKHMIAGYRCPSCGNVNLGYKGVLKDVQFRKTRTFDVTITDVPAVPYTGVQAFSLVSELPEEFTMTKEHLKKKLLEAGVEEALIDERLKQLDESLISSLVDIPDATALKEIDNLEKWLKESVKPEEDEDEEDEEDMEDEDEEKEKEEMVEVSPEFFKELSTMLRPVIANEVKKALAGFTVEVDGFDGLELEVKEVPEISELRTEISALKEIVENFTKSEEDRMKELLKEAPRGATLRVRRYKSQEPEERRKEKEKEESEDGVIVGADGHKAKTLSEFIGG